MALIIDSRLTLAGSTQPCTESHPEGCKAVLVRPDILLAITGVFNDPVNGVDWKVGDATKRLLMDLPQKLEEIDLNRFATAWFNVLVSHYRKKPRVGLDVNREVSTLLIATRVRNVPYLYKVVIYLDNHGLFKFTSTYLSVNNYPQLLYAGSCHDNINSHPSGGYVPAPDPPNELYKWELKELGDRKMSARSVDQFVPLLIEFELLLAKIGDSKNKCWIGPPYDVATWAKGETGWKVNFKMKCRPARGNPKPREARSKRLHVHPRITKEVGGWHTSHPSPITRGQTSGYSDAGFTKRHNQISRQFQLLYSPYNIIVILKKA